MISINGSATGTLEPNGDNDWFKITVTAGKYYIVHLEGNDTNRGTLADPFVHLYNVGGGQIAFDDDGGIGLNSRFEFVAPSNGTMFVGAGSFNDVGAGTYLVSVVDAATISPLTDPVGGFHGDFNGNGRADIVFRSPAGALSLWQTNANGGFSGATSLGIGSGRFHRQRHRRFRQQRPQRPAVPQLRRRDRGVEVRRQRQS